MISASKCIPIRQPSVQHTIHTAKDSSFFTNDDILNMSFIRILIDINLNPANATEVSRLTQLLTIKIKKLTSIASLLQLIKNESHPLAKLIQSICVEYQNTHRCLKCQNYLNIFWQAIKQHSLEKLVGGFNPQTQEQEKNLIHALNKKAREASDERLDRCLKLLIHTPAQKIYKEGLSNRCIDLACKILLYNKMQRLSDFRYRQWITQINEQKHYEYKRLCLPVFPALLSFDRKDLAQPVSFITEQGFDYFQGFMKNPALGLHPIH